MAFPVVEDIVATVYNSDVEGRDLSLAYNDIGDMIVVFFTCDGYDVDITIDEVESGTNWHQLTTYGSTNHTTSVFYKIAETAGSDVLYLDTIDNSEKSTSISYAISGHGGFEPEYQYTWNIGSTNVDPPSLTPIRTGNYVWLVYGATDGIVVASAAPTDFSVLTTQAGASDNASSSSAQRNLDGVSGVAYNPGAFTSDTAEWVAYTVAIAQPAVTGIGISGVGFNEYSI